jgi:hypothetical protein
MTTSWASTRLSIGFRRSPCPVPEAKQALAALALKIPDNPDLQLILAFTGPAYPRDAESQLAALLQNQPPSHPLAGDQPRQHAPVA